MPRSFRWNSALSSRVSMVALLAVPLAACSTQRGAPEPTRAELVQRLAALETLVREQQAALSANTAALRDHQAALSQHTELVRSALVRPGAATLSQQMAEAMQAPPPTSGPVLNLGTYSARGLTQVAEAPSAAPSAPPPASQQVAQAADERARNDQITPGGGVLLRRGELSLEPAVEYVANSSRRVEMSGFTVLPAILIGSFELRDTLRDTVVGSLTARYGVTDDFEMDVRVPYVYRMDRTRSRPLGNGSSGQEVFETEGGDLGDIEFGLHHQINEGRNDWPIFVGNMRVKSTTGRDPFETERDSVSGLETKPSTGSGFWSFEPSLTMITASDPAVFYANLSYIYNHERTIEDSSIDPGDVIGTSFGVSLALNDRTSVSFGGDWQFVGITEQDGEALAGADRLTVGRAVMGLSHRLNERMGLNFSFAYGITEDAPDAQFMIKTPIKFDLGF